MGVPPGEGAGGGLPVGGLPVGVAPGDGAGRGLPAGAGDGLGEALAEGWAA